MPPADATARFLALGGARAMLVRPAGMVLAFMAHVALARMMGTAEYGAFIYVYFWTFFLGLLARLGLDRSAVRFGTGFIAQGDFGALRTLIQHSFNVALTLGAGAALAMGLLVVLWPWDMNSSQRDCFLVGVLVVPLLAAHNVYEGLAQARKRVWQATIPEQVLRQSLLGLAGAGVYSFNGGTLSAVGAMSGYVLALTLTLAVDWAWYRLTRPAEIGRAAAAPVRREWLGYAVQMSAVTLIGSWILQADLLLVGALLGTEAAGVYSVASRVASLVAGVGVAATLVFGPVIAELADRNETAKLQHYSTLVARGMGLAALGLGLALWFARDVVFGLFGPGFVAATVPLGILLIGNVLREFFGPAFALLNLSGLQKTALLVLSASALLNLAANVALIMRLGTPGAALATALTVAGYSLAFWSLVRTRLGIDTGAWPGRLARASRI